MTPDAFSSFISTYCTVDDQMSFSFFLLPLLLWKPSPLEESIMSIPAGRITSKMCGNERKADELLHLSTYIDCLLCTLREVYRANANKQTHLRGGDGGTGGEGGAHSDDSGGVSAGEEGGAAGLKKAGDGVVCVAAGLRHRHALSNARIRVQHVVSVQLRRQLDQLHLELGQLCVLPRPRRPQPLADLWQVDCNTPTVERETTRERYQKSLR